MRERIFDIFQYFSENFDFPRIASDSKKVTKIFKNLGFEQFVECHKPIPNSEILAFTEGVELQNVCVFQTKNRNFRSKPRICVYFMAHTEGANAPKKRDFLLKTIVFLLLRRGGKNAARPGEEKSWFLRFPM